MASRQQKRELLKRRRAEQKKLHGMGEPRPKKTVAYKKPWVINKQDMVMVPSPLKGLTHAQRIEIVRAIVEKAKEEFNTKYPKIQEWFKEYDALYLLSFCAVYFLSHPEGIDPEADGSLDFYPYYIEIMQAFALSQARSGSGKPLLENAMRLQKEMKEIGQATSIRMIKIPSEESEESEAFSHKLLMEMRSSTTAVRNWAYFHQMKRVMFDLAQLMDPEFRNTYGISCKKFFEVFFALIEERNDLLHEHLTKIRGFYRLRKTDHKTIIKAYNETFPENEQVKEEEMEELWVAAGKDKRSLAGMLVCHADLKLEDIFSFSISHAKEILNEPESEQALGTLLDRLSIAFGELENANKEHLILNNPVTRRPFIKTSKETYFTSIWGTLAHFSLDILEDLVEDSEELKEKYNRIKAKYLEDEVEKMCREYFPSAQIYRGSLWEDGAKNIKGENDLIVLIGKFALVIEAKSGGIRDRARRGDPAALFDTLRALIEEPSEQAFNFIELLQREKGAHEFRTRDHGTNTIDSTNISYYIPLGVTFSNLGGIGGNLKKLIDAKVINKTLEQLAPSVSFTDLETVLGLLESEPERIHYLARRREFEAHMIYEGDELDLLGFYLDNSFNIGETEYAQDVVLNIGLKSKELDPYVVAKSEGKVVERPRLAMTQWWRDLINRIAAKKPEGWVEMCFVLLNSSKDDQEKFEKALGRLKGRIRKGRIEKPHNWVAFLSGPERRRYLIAGYPYETEDRSLRNNIMNQIIDDESAANTRGAVIIGVKMGSKDYPYSVLANRASTDLFDVLTLPPKPEDEPSA